MSRRTVLAGTAAGGLVLGAGLPASSAQASPDAASSVDRGQLEGGAAIPLGDFESGLDGWVADVEHDPDGVVTFRFEQTADRAKVGSHSAHLWADLSKGGWNVEAHRSLADLEPGRLPAPRIDRIAFWVYALNVDALLLRMRDATGQVHQQTLPLSASGQWQQVSVDDFAGGIDHSSWGGADDGSWHGSPARIGVLVDGGRLHERSLPGQVWLDGVVGSAGTPPPLTVTQVALGNVFAPGRSAEFDVASTEPRIEWTARDIWGNVVAAHKARVRGDTARVSVPSHDPGYYRFTVESAASTGGLSTPFAILPDGRATGDGNGPFGMMSHFHTWGTGEMSLLARSGAAQIRDEIFWADVEKVKGVYQFPDYAEAYMPTLAEHSIAPLIELDFANPNYDDGHTPYSDEGIAAYVEYGKQLLGHYGRQIRWVEIWNEYNIPAFSNGPGATDVHNYYKILSAASAALKRQRPDLTIVAPGTAGVPLAWIEQLFELGGLEFIDAVSMHPYRYPAQPEGLVTQMHDLDELIRRYNGGRPKPMWITEIGWPTDTSHHIGERTQAEDIVRANVLSLAAGVQKLFWYDFMNDGTDPAYNENNFGVLRAAADSHGRYTPKPAYSAYTVLTCRLADARYVGSVDGLPDGVLGHVFRRGRDELRVLWSPGRRQDVTLHVAGPVDLTDLMGRTRRCYPVGGTVFASLGDDPIYVEGRVRAVSSGAPVRLSTSTAAVGEPVSVTATLDRTDTPAARLVSFELVGESRPLVLHARGANPVQKTTTVTGLEEVGTRTVIADVGMHGRLVGRLASDGEIAPAMTLLVAPVVSAEPAAQPALRVTVQNNSGQTARHVAGIGWSVGSNSGTVDVNDDVPAGTVLRHEVPLTGATVKTWTPYAASVTVTVDGLDDLTYSGTVTFDPVLPRTVTVDGAIDAGVGSAAGIDLTGDGTWVPLLDVPRTGSSDAGGRVWMFHDEDMLYLTAEITDQTFSQDYTGGDTWQGDSLQFALASGPPGNAGDPYRFELALTPDGPQLNCDLAPAGSRLGLIDSAEVAIVNRPGATVYEVGIPWAVLPLSGDTDLFCFSLLYNDNDGDGRKGYLEWASGLGSGSVQTSQFFTCQFIRA